MLQLLIHGKFMFCFMIVKRDFWETIKCDFFHVKKSEKGRICPKKIALILIFKIVFIWYALNTEFLLIIRLSCVTKFMWMLYHIYRNMQEKYIIFFVHNL